MKVIHGLEALTAPLQHSTVAIGSFDGVHLGHQALIRQAVEDARRHSRTSVVFTFDRHPAELLRPDAAPPRLAAAFQRERFIGEWNPDYLVVARFEPALASLGRDEFLWQILKGMLGAEAIVEGIDFGFGKNREGNVAYLQQMQQAAGFVLYALSPVLVNGMPASSTHVRDLLHAGQVEEAADVLGRPYWLAGTVEKGMQLGRTLGYPTANLHPAEKQMAPADGIYAVMALLEDGIMLPGACSIGSRPTVEGAGRSIETYLLNYEGDLYGRRLEIGFVKRLRDELKFDDLQSLQKQMAADVEQTRQVMKDIRL